jgi:predicted outer membrane protein
VQVAESGLVGCRRCVRKTTTNTRSNGNPVARRAQDAAPTGRSVIVRYAPDKDSDNIIDMPTKSAAALAAGLFIASLCKASDQFPADTDFVRRAEQAANQEAADAQSAIQMSSDPAVKRFAAQMQRDANELTARLSALSVEKGWPNRSFGVPDNMNVYSDHDYITRQIRAQRNLILYYKGEAANGADTDLQEFARQILPVMERNLAALQAWRSS